MVPHPLVHRLFREGLRPTGLVLTLTFLTACGKYQLVVEEVNATTPAPQENLATSLSPSPTIPTEAPGLTGTQSPQPTPSVDLSASPTVSPPMASPSPEISPTESPISNPTQPPDLPRIGPGNTSRLRLWRSFEAPDGYVFSPDWTTLAAQTQDHVRLYDVKTAELRRTLQKDPAVGPYDFQFVFSTDGGRLAWTAHEGVIEVQDVMSGGVIQSLEEPFVTTECCAEIHFSPDGRLLAAAMSQPPPNTTERLLQVFEVATGQLIYSLREPWGFEFSSSGRFMAALHKPDQTGDEFAVYDSITKKIVLSMPSVNTYHFLPDGKTLVYTTWTTEIQAVFLDLETMRQTRTLKGFVTAAPLYLTYFSPDWQTLVWYERGTSQLQDVSTGELSARFDYHFLFSPDGQVLAGTESDYIAAHPNLVMLFDRQSGEELHVLDHGDEAGEFRQMAFSPDGRVLASDDTDDAVVRLWHVAKGKALQSINGSSAEFSPDGRLLAVKNGNQVELWAILP